MVCSCCAYNCTNRYGVPGIKFFRFPAEKQRRDKWVSAIRRHKWKPNEYSRVCSSHFISGSPSKDPLSPVYVPSVFSFTGKKSTNRYFRAKCRKIHPIKRSQLVKRRKQSQSLSAGAAAADTDNVQNESQSKSSDDEVRINVEVMTDIEMITLPECLEFEPQIPEDIPLFETATFALENKSSQFEHPVEINTDSDFELENAKIEDNHDDFCDAEMEVADLDYINDELTELECQIEDKEVEIGEMQIEMECLKNKYEILLEENVALKSEVSLLRQLNETSLQSDQQSSNVVDILDIQVCYLQNKLERLKFGANILKESDDRTLTYTGLPKYELFLCLFEQLVPVITNSSLSSTAIPMIDQFFIVLTKLRFGYTNDDLACRMDVSSPLISAIFHNWIDTMSVELKCLIPWPDREQLHHNMPRFFRKHFSMVRCIIDCFEVFIERLSSLDARAKTYSNYKKHNTIKVLLAVTPTGSICFISKAWGGRVSDKVITQRCRKLKMVIR